MAKKTEFNFQFHRFCVALISVIIGFCATPHAHSQSSTRTTVETGSSQRPVESATAPTAVQRGTITGTVIADKGDTRGLRVTAHNLDYKLWYTVFTYKGKYTIPQALPGLYDISVIEEEFESPTHSVRLGSAGNEKVDLQIKSRPLPPPDPSTIYVDRLDQMYPPGPGRELIHENCLGCHMDSFGTMKMTTQGYMAAIARMTETGPGFTSPYALNVGTPLTGSQKQQIAEYLAQNFGPGSKDRKVRIEQAIIDEEATRNSIYVSYDIPSDMPISPRRDVIGADMVDGIMPKERPYNSKNNYLHDPYISPVDGSIWYGAPVANSIVRLDPKNPDPLTRWTVYPILGEPYVFPHGITMDSKGKVYWAEIQGSRLGELDPSTGKQIRHFVPRPGSMVQVIADKDDNIFFQNVIGDGFGKLDAKTRKVHEYIPPTRDNGLYGMAVAPDGNIWSSSWNKNTIVKFDKEQEALVEYKIPNNWGAIRRIGVDSKGIVWFGEYNMSRIGRLDPKTGQISEIDIPTIGADPYDVWPDKDDNIWTPSTAQSSLIKYNQKTGKFTYYPEPQLNWSLPKIEIEANNTIWFGARYLPHITANHFYPDGYSASAPPLP